MVITSRKVFPIILATDRAESPLKKGRLTTFDCPIGWLYLQPDHHREALKLLQAALGEIYSN